MLSQTRDDKSQQYCENLLFFPLEGGAKSFHDKIGRPFAASRVLDFMEQVFSCNVPSCSTKHCTIILNKEIALLYLISQAIDGSVIKRC